jgi:hypothetical protein
MDIDSIDITDSAFSLDIPNSLDTPNSLDITNIVTGGSDSITTTDYTMFIYIGIASILLAVGMFIYKTYKNNKNEMVENCPGGFCTMNNQETQQTNYQDQQMNHDTHYTQQI